MEWNLINFLFATLAVSGGALLQAATGLGGGLIIVPLLAMISFSLIPGPMAFASLVLTTAMTIRGRHDIEFANIVQVIMGLTLGSILAATYIAKLPLSRLGIVFGLLILISVFISLYAKEFKLKSNSLFSISAVSGFMGTSAGVGAPVLAMLYQNKPGPALRATLAFLYLIATLIMLLCLNFAGRFGILEVISGFYLMPGFLMGYWLSPRLVRFIDQGYARPAVLIMSSISAVLLIGKSVYRLYL